MEQETEDCLHVAAFGAARVRSNRNNFQCRAAGNCDVRRNALYVATAASSVRVSRNR